MSAGVLLVASAGAGHALCRPHRRGAQGTRVAAHRRDHRRLAGRPRPGPNGATSGTSPRVTGSRLLGPDPDGCRSPAEQEFVASSPLVVGLRMGGEHAAYRVTVVCWGTSVVSPMGGRSREGLRRGRPRRSGRRRQRRHVDRRLGWPMDRRTTARCDATASRTPVRGKRARQFEPTPSTTPTWCSRPTTCNDEILRRRAYDEDDVAKVCLLRS